MNSGIILNYLAVDLIHTYLKMYHLIARVLWVVGRLGPLSD